MIISEQTSSRAKGSKGLVGGSIYWGSLRLGGRCLPILFGGAGLEVKGMITIQIANPVLVTGETYVLVSNVWEMLV